MGRYIDADVLIADMRERYCKPCQERKEDYNGVKCRACWVDDAMDDVDGFGDNGIDIVRCKECKHGTWYEEAEEYICIVHDQDLFEAEHFCSYGERKESE